MTETIGKREDDTAFAEWMREFYIEQPKFPDELPNERRQGWLMRHAYNAGMERLRGESIADVERLETEVASVRLAGVVCLERVEGQLEEAVKVVEKMICTHRQWFISRGVKHVTHEATCVEDKECRDPCPRCAFLASLEEHE